MSGFVIGGWQGWREPPEPYPPARLEYSIPLELVVGKTANAVGRILGPSPRVPADGGLLAASQTRPIPFLYRCLWSNKGYATSKHYVLGGAWDRRKITFPDRPSQQPPPTCCDKYRYLAPGAAPDLSAFRSLLGFGR